MLTLKYGDISEVESIDARDEVRSKSKSYHQSMWKANDSSSKVVCEG